MRRVSVDGKAGARGENLWRVIRHLYSHPRVTITELAKETGLDYRTASRCVNDMATDGVLVCDTSVARNRIYSLKRYLDLFVSVHFS